MLNRATPRHASATLAMPSKKRKQRELAKAGKGAQPLSAFFWCFDLVLHKFVKYCLVPPSRSNAVHGASDSDPVQILHLKLRIVFII